MTPVHLSKKLISWASILEANTREQAETSATMPFIYPHIALMPDAHLGKGATVGSVIPTRGAIMPAAIGNDVGCGMVARMTDLTYSDIEGRNLSDLRKKIEQVVPLSPGKYNSNVEDDAQPLVECLENGARFFSVKPEDFAENWRLQLGSLGGGNHFIEICLDEKDRVWVFLHTGSRGVGNKIAQKYIRIAAEKCERWFIDLPHHDLAYLVDSEPEFWEYIRHMSWAQDFATYNRELIAQRVVGALQEWYGHDVETLEVVNCSHNYTTKENHFGSDVWVSRKGAISARAGQPGLIPGSMGTRSYVVVGKGNPVSLCSAPHGAGRQHSRTQARKLFTQDDLRERMKGIEYRDDPAFIDEIPDAYKPIDQVMEDSSDLVEVLHELRQIVNVKGE